MSLDPLSGVFGERTAHPHGFIVGVGKDGEQF
jgi:hypothetical protein